MDIISSISGIVGTNQYLAYSEGYAYAIDAPDGNESFVRGLKDKVGKLDGILLTHGHFDHTAGLPTLLRAFPGTPVYLEKNDWYLVKEDGNRRILAGMGMWSFRLPDSSSVDFLDYPETLGPFKVLRTPGHTMGSICLLSEKDKVLFSGDTLFSGGEGRTDLGGSYRAIQASLAALMELDGETKVLSGHGEDTTIGSERSWRR